MQGLSARGAEPRGGRPRFARQRKGGLIPIIHLRSFLQERRKAIAAGIVLTGLAAGLVIYLTASPPSENPLGYRPEDTKRYLREMEVYGGKANVMASELREWFAGLWHGRSLGFTVATLAVLLAGAFLFAVTPLPAVQDPGGTEESGRDAPGS